MKTLEPITEVDFQTEKFLVAEIVTTYNRRKQKTSIKVTTSNDCHRLVKRLFKDDEIEHRERMYAVYLSRRNEVLGWQLQGLGGVSGTACDLKVVFQTGLLCNTSAIILAHNHPSGNLKPSQSDIDITRKAKDFGRFIEMQILDHLIVTLEGYYSFSDDGMI